MGRYNDAKYRCTLKEKSSVGNSIELEGYKKGYKDGYKDGTYNVIDATFIVTAYTIQYKLGFGKKRLQRIMNAIYQNIDSFRTGQLSKEDLQTIEEELKSKYNIEIVLE